MKIQKAGSQVTLFLALLYQFLMGICPLTQSLYLRLQPACQACVQERPFSEAPRLIQISLHLRNWNLFLKFYIMENDKFKVYRLCMSGDRGSVGNLFTFLPNFLWTKTALIRIQSLREKSRQTSIINPPIPIIQCPMHLPLDSPTPSTFAFIFFFK